MAFMNFIATLSEQLPAVPSGFWQRILLDWFSFIPSYGLRVIVFTLILKLLLSPLDIYQRVMMKKNQRIQQRLRPEVEKLEKQYTGNPQALQQKKNELNKKEGVKVTAGCLPMLVTLGISMWLLMGGLSPISQYKNMAQYIQLYDVYNQVEIDVLETEYSDYFDFSVDSHGKTIVTLKSLENFENVNHRNEIEAKAYKQAREAAQAAVTDKYLGEKDANGERTGGIQEGFLWVENIWVADVFWAKPIMNFSNFSSAVGKFGQEPSNMSLDIETEYYVQEVVGSYTKVTGHLYASEENARNGLLMLPLMSVGIMILSQFLMRRLQKKGGTDMAMGAGGMGGAMGGFMGSGKMMTYMMPVMFGVFTLFYTAAFSLYMITNSFVMIIISLSSGGVIELLDRREKKVKVTATGIERYGRLDPNDKDNINSKRRK